MPVRSLRSSVLKWPDRESVHRAVAEWTRHLLRARADIVRVGYFGSYARGDWGIGSDLDIMVIVKACDDPFERRHLGHDILDLPVSADLIVYTDKEWRVLGERRTKFYRYVMDEVVWLHPRLDEPSQD